MLRKFVSSSLCCLIVFASVSAAAQPLPDQKPEYNNNASQSTSTPLPNEKPDTPALPLRQPDIAAPIIQPPTPREKPNPLSLIKDKLHQLTSRNASKAFNSKKMQATIARYREIFALQEQARFSDADKALSKLKNKSLMGHVLLHRYMHPQYPAHFEELVEWLKNYGDHPTAMRIYKLAKNRMPEGYRYQLKEPYQETYLNGSWQSHQNQPKRFAPLEYQRTDTQNEQLVTLRDTVQNHIEKGFPTGALQALNTSPLHKVMSQSEKDTLLSKIARSYLIEGKPEDAFNIASVIADRYGTEIPLSGWVAGIAAWQQKRYALAAQNFQQTASSDYSNVWMRSAAGYWASRAFSQINNKDKADYWLRETALYSRTFYGLLANKKLGVTEDFDWTVTPITTDDTKQLTSIRRGERAYILAELGFKQLASLELEAIDPNNQPALKQSMLRLGHKYNLSRFLYKFGQSFRKRNGNAYDAALYPVLETPIKKIDKALIHAIVRQESRFKEDASSLGGAMGLMQLLPSTAAYITKTPKLETTQKHLLLSESKNIDIGERYVSFLLENKDVNNDLFSLLVAYNAGPGKLSRWKKKINVSNDPLLFIELLPSAETRAFVEHVMANLWVYRTQFGQTTPSLEAVIYNVHPPYRRLDN